MWGGEGVATGGWRVAVRVGAGCEWAGRGVVTRTRGGQRRAVGWMQGGELERERRERGLER